MGDALHHHHVLLDGIVIRGPAILHGAPIAFCDVGTLMTPQGYPNQGALRFRLVALGADAATLARCLPLRGRLVFEGTLIHTEPPGPDGKCRGTYLGAGSVVTTPVDVNQGEPGTHAKLLP